MRIFLLVTASLLSYKLAYAQNYGTEAQISLERHISHHKSAGITAGYATADTILWIGYEGWSDIKAQKPINASTLFRTASIAKPITAVAIMQLYEKGKIDLDLPIREYLPTFPIKNGSLITVRHLLQHTSGIAGYKSSKESETTEEFPTLRDAMKVFEDRSLKFTPGSNFLYTSYGYVVLGWIIEEISGLSFEDYVKDNIFIPSGMLNTGIEKFSTFNPNESKLYRQKNTNYKKYSSENNKIKSKAKTNLSNRVPGGGFYSTAADLLKFGQAVLNHQLISKESLALIWTDPKIRKEGNSYGMGWFLYGPNPKFGNVYGHGGAQTGASSQLMILPEQDIVAVIMSNTSRTGGHVFGMMLNLMDHAYNDKHQPTAK